MKKPKSRALNKIKELDYRDISGYLKSNSRCYIGIVNDDIVDKLNEAISQINYLTKELHKKNIK